MDAVLTVCRYSPTFSTCSHSSSIEPQPAHDEYGGGIEGRARILFEVVEAVIDEVEPSRVGVKISPMHEGGASPHTRKRCDGEYAIRSSALWLSHLLLMGNTTDFPARRSSRSWGTACFATFVPSFGARSSPSEDDCRGGNRLIEEAWPIWWRSDGLISANPDLVERLAPARRSRRSIGTLFYAAGPRGYSDYPTLEPVTPMFGERFRPDTTPPTNPILRMRT